MRANVGNAVVCVALRNIKAWEEVTENYGVHHTSDSTAARNKIMVSNYGFQCRLELRDPCIKPGDQDSHNLSVSSPNYSL